MDQMLGNYLAFKLIHGTWPSTIEQIVVEEYLVTKMGIDINRLPYSIEVFINNKKKTFVITGIISNYSSNLTIDGSSTLNTNVYPSIICGGSFSDTDKISLVVSQKKLNFKLADDDIFNFLYKYGQITKSKRNISCNERLNWHGYADLKDIINSKFFHTIILYLFLLIIEIVIIRTFFIKNKKTFYIFKSLGLSSKSKKIMLIWIVSLFLITALLLSYLLIKLISIVYLDRIFPEYKYAYNQEIIKCFITQLITIFIFLIGYSIIILIAKDMEIIYGIRKITNKNIKIKFKKIDMRTVFMHSVLLFCIIASLNFMSMFKTDNTIKYYLSSKRSYACDEINTYTVALYQDRYYSFSVLEPLKKYSDYLNFSMEGEALQFSILLDKERIDPYFNKLINRDADNSMYNRAGDYLPFPADAENYLAIPSHEFVIEILPDKEFIEFAENFNINTTHLETVKNRSCVLIIPNYNLNDDNASIKEKGYVNIGGIKKINDEVSFQIEKFKVEHLITYVTSEWAPIKMVLSEEQAQNSSIILGYHNIDITVKNNISTDLLHEIDNSMHLLAASIQGGVYGSSLQIAMENKLLKNYTNLLSNTILIYCIISLIIYIILSSFINWENNKHEYGVLRSFGMSYRTLQHKLFIQFTTSILISTVIAAMLGSLAFPDKYGMTYTQVILSALIALIITYVCRVCLHFIYRKQTISSMINNS